MSEDKNALWKIYLIPSVPEKFLVTPPLPVIWGNVIKLSPGFS